MRRILACLAVSAALPLFAAAGATEIDDIVRLPGETQRPERGPRQPEGMRYVPAGGLFASFDTNEDGVITQDELAAGIRATFTEADANADGNLSALEQQAWAAELPVRDDTLANPVRFDPNLDRIVTFEEFNSILLELAANYQDLNGDIAVTGLLVPEREERRGGLLGSRGATSSQR